MTTTVFIPAHITGFFTIYENSDLLKKGSCGAGFLLDKGVKTTIKESSFFDIEFNQGSDIIINEVLKYFDVNDNFKIIQDIQVPIGRGFGTSAASALSLTYSLNEFFDYGYSKLECGQIAHKVDVGLGGGLGDVIAQTGSGIVLRTHAGAPGIGKIKSFDEKIIVGVKSYGDIDTSSVIGDENYKQVISKTGFLCLEDFKTTPNVDNFLKLSVRFSENIGLMTSEVHSLIKYFNSCDDILGSSMAMLGNTVFAFSDNESAFKDLNIENIDIYQLYRK